MLSLEIPRFYQVQAGQSVKEIAKAFCVSEFALVKENHLKNEPRAGQILKIPIHRGNEYFLKEKEDTTLLCGSEENFEKKNKTSCFYPAMRVIL